MNNPKVSVILPVYNVEQYLRNCLDSVVNQYVTTVRVMHTTFIEPTKRYADIIIPEGGSNTVAIDLLATKISSIIRGQ